MIGIVVREMTYFKILSPIIFELQRRGIKFNFYYMDNYKGSKEYIRPTLAKIKAACPEVLKGTLYIKKVESDGQLLKYLVKDGVKKLVSVEIWMWARSYIKSLTRFGIKTYSILYLSDSLWQSSSQCISNIDKTYYSARHLINTHHSFLHRPIDNNRTMFLE